MNKMMAAVAPVLALLFGLLLSAGPADAQAGDPLPVGADVTLRNTLQDPGEPETPFPALFGQPVDAFDENGTVSDGTPEFPTALAQPGTPVGDISGLYEIDMTGDSISFTMLPAADDPFWVNVFGDFPAGKFDRYYFTFSEPHNISGFTSNNSAVALRIESPRVVVVEIGEGYKMSPPRSFTIGVQGGSASTGELALTGVETAGLAVAAVAMIAAGSMMVQHARRFD